MFNWSSSRKKREKLIEQFSEYLSPAAIESAALPEFSKLNDLSQGPVEFVFVLVQGTSPNETGELLGSVAANARRNGWMVQDLLCNLAVLVNGTLPVNEWLFLERLALVDRLLQGLGTNIKIVHGVEVASFGSMGGQSRITYGVLLPSFLEVIASLKALSLGAGR